MTLIHLYHSNSENTKINSQLIGAYNFQNIAIAVAIGAHFNISVDNLKSSIESYIPANNRSQLITRGSNKILLDAYNANPTSMMAALKSFKNLKDNNKYLFLGDMFELGEESKAEHQVICDFVQNNFDRNIILVGEHFYEVKGNRSIKKFKSFEDLKIYLNDISIEKASILIKASRGMALERILDLI